jgi:hypothetical protein
VFSDEGSWVNYLATNRCRHVRMTSGAVMLMAQQGIDHWTTDQHTGLKDCEIDLIPPQ